MNIDELDKVLKEYNEDELYYRDYYYAKQNPDTYKAFIENLDTEFIKNKKLLIPEYHTDFNSSFMQEDPLFTTKREYNILILKHHRFTPVFNHSHGFFEMIYVYSGSCTQKISGDEIILNKGDICIIPPEVEHSIGIFDDSVIINILIRKSTFSNTFLEVLSDENIISSFFTKILYTKNYNNYIIFRTNNNLEIKKILSDIIIEDIENKRYCNKILDNLLMIFFAYLLRNTETQVELPNELQKSSKQLSSILTYIQGNFKTVTLEELSCKFHFTVPYLSKLIKTNTGHNFKEMIQTIKLNKAIELLTLSDLNIYTISETIGYENTTHFIRTFKKVYGISPNQYRKKVCAKI